MHIGIMGVGAIGGVIGGYLTRAHLDITLIDMWPANVDKIKTSGLTVTTIESEFNVNPSIHHISDMATEKRQFDVAFLCMKSYDTQWATEFIRPHLSQGGFIVSAQNGINEDIISNIVGWPRVVGCVLTFGAGMYEPGHAERTSADDRKAITLGEPNGLITPRLTELATILNIVGITETTTNLWGHRWAKLAGNSMSNALAGCTGLTSAELRNDENGRAIGIRIAAELVAVAQALGVTVEPIGGIPASLFLEAISDSTVENQIGTKMTAYGQSLGVGRPSLAQDVMKGRSTEIDFLNGLVVRKGKEIGVKTPINEQVISLTKKVESGEIDPSPINFQKINLDL